MKKALALLLAVLSVMTASLCGCSAFAKGATVEKADSLYYDEEYEDAVDMYIELLDDDPELLEAYVGLGKCYEKLEQPEDAYDIYIEGMDELGGSDKLFRRFKQLLDAMGVYMNDEDDTLIYMDIHDQLLYEMDADGDGRKEYDGDVPDDFPGFALPDTAVPDAAVPAEYDPGDTAAMEPVYMDADAAWSFMNEFIPSCYTMLYGDSMFEQVIDCKDLGAADISSFLFGYVNHMNMESPSNRPEGTLQDGYSIYVPEAYLRAVLCDMFGAAMIGALDLSGVFTDGYYCYEFNDFDIYCDVPRENVAAVAAEPGEYTRVGFNVCDNLVDDAYDIYWLDAMLVNDPGSSYGCHVGAFRIAYGQTVYPDSGYDDPPEAAHETLFDANGFIFPHSSEVTLSEDELLYYRYGYDGYTFEEILGFARNEIFARHGNQFSKSVYQQHYGQYDWYNSLYKYKVSGDELNSVEKYNVSLIKDMEEAMGY